MRGGTDSVDRPAPEDPAAVLPPATSSALTSAERSGSRLPQTEVGNIHVYNYLAPSNAQSSAVEPNFDIFFLTIFS
jgi:hypothetical protein